MIIDAGVLFASIDRADRHHGECLELLATHVGPLRVPTLAIAEVAHLIQTRLQVESEIRLLGDLAAGQFIAEPVAPADWLRIADLVSTYRDLRLGTTDASVVAAAERLGIHEVATLDRRHFTVVQPSHGPLTLLP